MVAAKLEMLLLKKVSRCLGVRVQRCQGAMMVAEYLTNGIL